MYITMVKKILADGSPCRKCREVESRLVESGLMDRIDEVVIADERQPHSAGMHLATKHQVKLAPFFIVRDDEGKEEIHTVFYRFLKEVLNRRTSESEEIKDIMDNNPDLDYL